MVVHLLHTEQGAGSNPAVTTKFMYMSPKIEGTVN